MAVAIVVAMVPAPAPSPSPLAAVFASPSSADSALPSAVPTRTPQVTTTVVVLRVANDPGGAIATLTGCKGLTRVAGQVSPNIKGSEVDATAAAAGRTTGWIFVPPGIQAATKVWLGDDVVELALAAGQQVVAADAKGEIWLGGRAGATRWRPIATPAGLTAWVMTADDVTGTGECSSWLVPPVFDAERSITCAGLSLPGCLEVLAHVGATSASLLAGGSDVVVAAGDCPSWPSCPDVRVVVAVLPASRHRAADATAVGLDGSLTGSPFAVSVADYPYALDAITRPSLPLPTGGEKAKGNDCSEALAGSLRVAPWDPRVVWVGTQAVVWPTGTFARFLDPPIVSVPGNPYGAAATPGDEVLVTGTLDTVRRQFNACSLRLLPGASLPGAELPGATPALPDGRGTGD